MAAIDPQALYEEFQNDPTAIGYQVGNGVGIWDKQSMINAVIEGNIVQRISVDQVPDPGQVAEPVVIQLIRDSVDPDEYKANCYPEAGDTEVEIGQKEALRARILTFYGGSDGQSLFSFTDLSIAQILDLFSAAQWPLSRAAIFSLRDRDGSRAETLFGSPDAPVSQDDMKAADAWGVGNGLVSLYE